MTSLPTSLTPLSPLRWLPPPLPRAPLAWAIGEVARRVAARHPALFDRLAAADHGTLRLVPSDLPWQFLVRFSPRDVAVEVLPAGAEPPACAACVEGPLARLVACASGVGDGDAMFFARDIRVSGDTEVLVALRNALDDAEIDLAEAFASLAGPLARPVRRLLERAAQAYQGAEGVLDAMRADLAAPLNARIEAQARAIVEMQTEIARLNRRLCARRPEQAT